MTNQGTLLGLIKRKRPGLGTLEIEALLNGFPEAALVADLDELRILHANSKATELTAYTRSELSAIDLASLFTAPGSEEGTLVTLKDLAESKASAEFELIKRSGSSLRVQVKASLLGPGDSFLLVSFEPTYVHLQRQAELERQQSFWESVSALAEVAYEPELQPALLKVLGVGSSLLSATCLSVYQADGQNPVLKQTASLGTPNILPEEIAPQDLIDLQKPTVWARGKQASLPFHRLARSASLLYLASVPIGEPNASIGLVVIGGDRISPPENLLEILQFLSATVYTLIQREVVLLQLRQSINQFATLLAMNTTLLDSVEDGVIILSSDLSVQELNPSAELSLGYASIEVRGQAIENVLISSENLLAALQAARQDLRPDSMSSIRLYRRNGQPFLANLHLIPVTNEQILERFLVIIHDLSEQEEYRIRNQQLEQRALLGEVTASFAHEVRNPINNISTGLQLLALNLPADDVNQDNIRRLQSDCERLADLVKAGLTFVRPMEYKLEDVGLADVLSHLLDRMHTRITRTNIKYQFHPEDKVALVEGDLRALEQVFTNLINNAIQAMEETGGALALKIRRIQEGAEHPQIEVSVSDTGPGIPQDIRERIFEPFFTTKHNGTGLGLAIVKRIVTAHKGAIYVESIPGGTVFRVRLPCARESLAGEPRLETPNPEIRK